MNRLTLDHRGREYRMTPQLDRRSFLKAMGIVTAAAACGGGGTGAPAPATATGAAPTAAAKPSGRI
ncbi:MAG: twin-arginine translocation signal domain-containing protein [Gaiellaceae bacterium]